MEGRGTAKEPAVKKTWMLVLAGLVAGCQAQKPAAEPSAAARAISPAVLDVTAPTPAASTTPAPAYVAPQPANEPVAAPAAAVTQTPTVAAAPAAAGSSYTVKKGDTLFHIAKEHYGDGKKWQQIAAANPGVTPTSLKVGQTLVMPQ